MHAQNTQLIVFLQGQKHFMIPLFQRPYSWDKDNWDTLWADILETYEAGPDARHFMGSIVTKMVDATPEGVARYLVIDGQQRLITLSILLTVLRDIIRKSHPQIAEKIEDLYLTNRYSNGLSRYKVLPTQADRDAYMGLINGAASASTPSTIRRAYGHFMSSIAKPGPDGSQPELSRLEQVITQGLELVSITLTQDDNEYRIFESLNAKGEALTQADLMRNYFFMKLPANKHDILHENVWYPMQAALTVDNPDATKAVKPLVDFFFYEYASSGEFVRQGDVYQAWKARLDKLTAQGLEDKLKEFARHSRLYNRLIKPDLEPNTAIARQLWYLHRWGTQTTYPFLLNVYHEYDAGNIQAQDLITILRMVESFLVRRLFLNIPTNTLNRLFIRLATQLPKDKGLVAGTYATLAQPSLRWPTDGEFREAILTYPLFRDSRPDQRRLILEQLELSYPHKEKPDVTDPHLQIEHVMPQTLKPEWRAALGPDVDNVHRRLVHVLGNLTLTGYNPELSNDVFAVKRKLLADSNLSMNVEIAQESQWTAEQIVERGRRLANRAVKIWPGPH